MAGKGPLGRLPENYHRPPKESDRQCRSCKFYNYPVTYCGMWRDFVTAGSVCDSWEGKSNG